MLQRSRTEPLRDKKEATGSHRGRAAVSGLCLPPLAVNVPRTPVSPAASPRQDAVLADGPHCDPLNVPLPDGSCAHSPKVCYTVAAGVPVVSYHPRARVPDQAPQQTSDKKAAALSSIEATVGSLAAEVARAVGSAAQAAAYEVVVKSFTPIVDQDRADHIDVQSSVHAGSRPALRHTVTAASLGGTSVASLATQSQGPATSMQDLEEAICTGLVDSFFEGVRIKRQQVAYGAKPLRETVPLAVSGHGGSSCPDCGEAYQSDVEDALPFSIESIEGNADPDAPSHTSVVPTVTGGESESEGSGKDLLQGDGSECAESPTHVSSRSSGRLVSAISKRLRFQAMSTTSSSMKDLRSKIWPPTDSVTTLEGLRFQNDRSLSHMASMKTRQSNKPRFKWSTTIASLSSELGASALNLHGYAVTFWLQLWGVMPADLCGLPWNRVLCTLLAACSVAYSVLQMWSFSVEKFSQKAWGDFLLSACALGCLLSCKPLHQCGLLGRHKPVLLQYAEHRGFISHWNARSQKAVILTVLAWCLMVLSRILIELWIPGSCNSELDFKNGRSWSPTATRSVRALTFAFATGVITATALYVLHYLIGLRLAIGAFCLQCTEQETDCDTLKLDWNILQALLRQASLNTSVVFIWLVLSACIMFCSGTACLLFERPEPSCYLPSVVPVLLLILWVYRMMWIAASVTSTCLRMPAFINSLGQSGNNWEAQHLVEYVKNSAAGFYVQESVLTVEVVLKILYLSIVVMFTVFTKVLTEEGDV